MLPNPLPTGLELTGGEVAGGRDAWLKAQLFSMKVMTLQIGDSLQ